jgi:hypothetical protein
MFISTLHFVYIIVGPDFIKGLAGSFSLGEFPTVIVHYQMDTVSMLFPNDSFTLISVHSAC